MNKQNKPILWLVSWYPNKWDRFDGDFIQRHAKAAAVHQKIHVLFIKADERQTTVEQTLTTTGNLTEQIICLPKQIGIKGKVTAYLQWKRLYHAEVAVFVRQYQPALIHVHVPWKVGLVALWAKKKFGIPYIITEHWGIYNTVVEDNIHKWPFWAKHLLKRVYIHANEVVSVSQYLAKAINQFAPQNFTILPNVVDESLFQPSGSKYPIFTFIHVSNMVPLKNVAGILNAFKTATNNGIDAQLLLVGANAKKYMALADDLQPGASIRFLGEVSYEEVAAVMRQSHVLVINSNIENSPCVIGEALCCGLPVIATEVGGIPELVNEENGLLVAPADDASLSNYMLKMFRNYTFFATDQIAAKAYKRFSIHSLANQFKTLYERMQSEASG